jgi:pSer/pThr/pTyr-binding forkhead associated (FHA) protein
LPSVHDLYKSMATEPLTQEAGTAFAVHDTAHAFLVIHVEGEERSSRVIDLPDGIDVTFGRSRGATFNVESEKVSRMHARVKRMGETIEVEDLGSRNGTRVNGEKIEGIVKVIAGDEIAIGAILAVVGSTSGLRRASPIADDVRGEARLVAEVDRSLRYHRPLTLGLVRCTNDAVVDAMARSLRPMDLMAEDAGDDYLVILPELTRGESSTSHAALASPPSPPKPIAPKTARPSRRSSARCAEACVPAAQRRTSRHSPR